MTDRTEEVNASLLDRISIVPGVCGGKPIIRGHRMTVSMVLGMLADGASTQELLDHYDWLEIEDIEACLLYAAAITDKRRYFPVVDRVAS